MSLALQAELHPSIGYTAKSFIKRGFVVVVVDIFVIFAFV